MAPPPLPFAHLNLTRNPFGELDDRDLLAIAQVDPSRWIEHLREPSGVVLLLGEKGRGKTTSLKVLAAAIDAAYVHLDEERPRMPPLERSTVIDEAQRLGGWFRRRLWKDRRIRAIGSHHDHAAELRRSGRTVLVETLPLSWNATNLIRLVDERIDRFRRSEGPVPTLPPETAERLLREFGSDIRRLLGRLYDVVQRMSEVGPLANRL
ncbi:MAG TPA: hypothetical protein DCQ98_18550 [Planctomycetaceae bacterium]|nr:hypothetical protein [Planctomycetaceae bacterium]HRF00142.1 hypothetical protein [Pirellulaceae bacterium]